MRINKIVEELKKKYPDQKIEDAGDHVKIGQTSMNWKKARNLVR